MGDHLLTNLRDERQSDLALRVMRIILSSVASLAAVMTALFLLHQAA
jgi:hypothetical protein